MRRLITFMVSALVLLAIGWSSPDAKAIGKPDKVFIYGNIGGSTNWSPSSESQMREATPVKDGEWEVKVSKNDEFRICHKEGSTYTYFSAQYDSGNTNDTWGLNVGSKVGTWYCEGNSKKNQGFKDNADGDNYLYITYHSDWGNDIFQVELKNKSSIEPAKDFWLYRNTKEKDGSNNEIWAKVGKFSSTDNTNYEIPNISFTKNTSETYYMIVDADKGDKTTWGTMGGNKWCCNGDKDITNQDATGINTSNTNAYYTKYSNGDGTATFKLTWDGSTITKFRADVTYQSTPEPTYPDLYLYSSQSDKKVIKYGKFTHNGNGNYTYPLTISDGRTNYFISTTDVDCSNFEDSSNPMASGWSNDGFVGKRWAPATSKDTSCKDVWVSLGLTDCAFTIPENSASATFEVNWSDSKKEVKATVTAREIAAKTFYLYQLTGNNSWTKKGNFNSTDKKNHNLELNIPSTGDVIYMITDQISNDGSSWDKLQGKWPTDGGVDKNITNKTVTGIGQDKSKAYVVTYPNTNGKVKFSLVWDGATVQSFRADLEYNAPAGDKLDLVYTAYDKVNLLGEMPFNKKTGKYELKLNKEQIASELTADNYYLFAVTNYDPTKTLWSDYTDKIYTTTNSGWNKNAEIKKEGSQPISKNNENTFYWTDFNKNTALQVGFYIDLLSASKTFKIDVIENDVPWYFTGDMNNWLVMNSSMDNMEAYRFAPVVEDEDIENVGGDGTNWFVFKTKRMHGQFKIFDGIWSTNGDRSHQQFGHTESKDAAPADGSAYYSKTVPESMPSEVNVATLNHGALKNFHLGHNYYNNAKIYFNKEESKLFIVGDPEDLYIYYFNDGDDSELNGTKKLTYKATDANPNNINYYFDKRYLTQGFVSNYVLTDEEKAAPAFHGLVDKCYRAQVAPGLEEPYLTEVDGVDQRHLFEFAIENSALSSLNGVTHRILGHNYYFIYLSDQPVGVLLNYQYEIQKEENKQNVSYVYHVYHDGTNYVHHSGNDKVRVKAIKYRFVDVDNLGFPHYVKNDGSLTSDQNRENADVLVRELKLHLDTESTPGFTVPADTIYDGLQHWNGVARETGRSIVAKDATADWTDQINRVNPENLNRFVEFQVTLQDPDWKEGDGDKWDYNEYFSDFNYKKDEVAGQPNKDAYLPNESVDVSKLTSNYKLNGAHLYAIARSHAVGTNVPTAVDKIGDDVDANAEVVYYNLQGLRVENPTNGIFIKVQGKKATKVRF